MQYLSTEITIHASAETVWKHLVDLSAYEEWNPFIIEGFGKVEEGEMIDLTMQIANGKKMTFRPKILEASKGVELRWLGKLGFRGIFDGEHRFELRPTSDGVVLHQSERFSGILSRPMLHFIGKETLQNFKAMNQALKQRAEKTHGVTESAVGSV